MFTSKLFKRQTLTRAARKPSGPRPLRRWLQHEPLEDRMMLSAGTLLHSFVDPNPDQSGGGNLWGQTVADLDGNALVHSRYLFDSTTGELIQTFDNGGSNEVVAIGNKFLIGGSGSASLIDGLTGDVLQTFVNPSPNADGFGNRLAMLDNKVLIGAPLFDDDGTAENTGAAYLFDATDGQLLKTFRNLEPVDSAGGFGSSVALLGDNVLIAAEHGIVGGISHVGAVYRFDVNTGDLLDTIFDPQPERNGHFGSSMVVVGDAVVIGAPSFTFGDYEWGAGSAYLFEADSGATPTDPWNLKHILKSPNEHRRDGFGSVVAAVSGNVLVGASWDNTGANRAGAAYLFDGSSGKLLRTYLDPSPDPKDTFGYAVSGLGDDVLIGAPWDETEAHRDAGAVFSFKGFDMDLGDIAGRVFVDLNSNGINDDGAGHPQTFTVFLDLNANGARDAGEPVETTLGSEGLYAFHGLDPGTYSVVLDAQPGWTPTTGPQTVVVEAGKLKANVDFGNYVPSATTTYQQTIGKSTSKARPAITVDASGTVLDINVILDITHSNVRALSASLFSPNGTVSRMIWGNSIEGENLSNTVFDDEALFSINNINATAPYDGTTDGSDGSYRPSRFANFDGEEAQGKWVLTIGDRSDRKEAGVINSWSLIVTHTTPPPPVGISVSPTAGLLTGEDGASATFDVVLDTQPTADVTIGISSGEPSEGTVAPSSLTFTTGNWNTPQTVTVTGVDDALQDGNVGYLIVTAAAVSADANYNGLDAADVSVTNLDNEAPLGLAVDGIDPNTMSAGDAPIDVTISGSGFATGASVSFTNGAGPAPKASNINVDDAGTITATLSANKKAKTSTWDVVVTNPDGSTGACSGCFGVGVVPSAMAANQQFAMAAPLNEPTASSDTEPQRRSRRGAKDEVFSRLDRTERQQRGARRAANTSLRRLQAVGIDRAMADLAGLAGHDRIARRSRR